MMEPINLFDYEVLAQSQMPEAVWEFYEGGSDDEITLRANRTEFERIRLRPRVLIDVNHCDTSTSILGLPVRSPILVAPTSYQRMAHPDGECAMARGAGAAGVLMVASVNSTYTMEEIAQAATGPLWFQLYLQPTHEIAANLVRRAEDAGYQAVVLTVDAPVLGNRERDWRNDFIVPPPPFVYANLVGIEMDRKKRTVLTWQDVDWLRKITSLPVLVKGILTGEDAVLAVEHGVSGIIVSNHGGRQLDSAVTGIEVLEEVVGAVAGRCEVYVDGGIRRGTDVLKALALGARAVLVGRPPIWGLAVAGDQGVEHVLDILRAELERAMKLSGCFTISAINRALVKYDSYI